MCMKYIELCLKKKLPEIYPEDIYRGVNYTIILDFCRFYTPKWTVIVYCKEEKILHPTQSLERENKITWK